MGLQLFFRKGNKIQITPAGKYVYEHIRKVGNDIEKTLLEASVIQTGLNKNISIVCLDTHKPDSVLLPTVSYFKTKYPDIKVAVETMPAEDLRTSLINGETGLAFTVLYDIDMLGEEFVSVLIGESPHYVYMLKNKSFGKEEKDQDRGSETGRIYFHWKNGYDHGRRRTGQRKEDRTLLRHHQA